MRHYLKGLGLLHSVAPIGFVEELLSGWDHLHEAQLSVYPEPSFPNDDGSRQVHRVPVGSLRSSFEALLPTLGEQEIAFDSIVYSNARGVQHVPLVDFLSSKRRDVERASEALVAEYSAARAALFASGESYHLYLGILLSTNEWLKFMGRLLLLNLPDSKPVTDARWVGRRLIGGFGALRLSANTHRFAHFGAPRMVREW
ncbi:MAG TPA: hypothetical protein VHE78_05650 [Gemmatimonadaceae bacterium]|nr:hypothetical protein [Gemmatimonadaceae bacterium]